MPEHVPQARRTHAKSARHVHPNAPARIMDVTRYLKVALCLLAAAGSGTLALLGLAHHSMPGLSRAAVVVGDTYSQSSQSSQFWFLALLWSSVCAVFLWLAWRAFRT